MLKAYLNPEIFNKGLKYTSIVMIGIRTLVLALLRIIPSIILLVRHQRARDQC
jgi:hypothetical protein